jgi:hypothetical protein
VYFFLQRAAQWLGFHPHTSNFGVRLAFGFSEVLFYMQGIILPATRLLEPYFKRIFVKKVKVILQAITFQTGQQSYNYQTLPSGD